MTNQPTASSTDSNRLGLKINTDSFHLHLDFTKSEDRWSHVVSVWDDKNGNSEPESKQLVLRSVEGDSDQRWPPSPPLQDPDQHDLPQGMAVLAVGMAGKSHWSASYVAESNALFADLACLLKEERGENDWLGSVFEVDPDVRLTDVSNEQIHLQVGQFKLLIEAVGGEGWSTRLSVQEGKILVSPVNVPALSDQALRWGFRLKFS